MLKFEDYLTDFTSTVNIVDFLINLIVATILTLIIKWFYIRYGKSLSNREKFAVIFVPMALATMLIITVVQASIALSLGLVGALSIVRFRAAIKEPEELTFIFLVIGIGLTCGANKPLLAIVATVFILPLVYINSRFSYREVISNDKVLVNLMTSSLDLEQMSSILTSSSKHVELKRALEDKDGLQTSFLIACNSLESISKIKSQLKASDPNISIDIIDQSELVL